MAGTCEYGNELPRSMKYGEFLPARQSYCWAVIRYPFNCIGDFAYANGFPVVAKGRNIIVCYRADSGRQYGASKRAMTIPEGETCWESEDRKFTNLYLHREPLQTFSVCIL